ncbi:MAG: UbiA family prenyltransferase, partial [Acidobacteriota bacterium]
MNRFFELTKPRITLFILMSTAVGFLLGTRLGNPWTLAQLLHCLLGTFLIASGTAALNQWYEREGDALMKRTQRRPIPSGRVSANAALIFGSVISAAGFAELCLGDNLLTGGLALFTLA